MGWDDFVLETKFEVPTELNRRLTSAGVEAAMASPMKAKDNRVKLNLI